MTLAARPAIEFISKTLGGGYLMGVGYTGGAYTGYGASNTWDPYGIHAQAKSYNRPQYIKIDSGMSYYYRKRSYYPRRYSRSSYYRKRRPYYRRRYRYY